MFRSATCARIIPKEFSEKYLYHWIENISFLFISLSVSHSAAGSSHSIEMSSLHNNFHFNDTTFKTYCIHWAIFMLSHFPFELFSIILEHYFEALFSLLCFLSPHHSSKLSITIIGAYLLFSTGCPRKNVTLFWRAVAPINFELGIKVGGCYGIVRFSALRCI